MNTKTIVLSLVPTVPQFITGVLTVAVGDSLFLNTQSPCCTSCFMELMNQSVGRPCHDYFVECHEHPFVWFAVEHKRQVRRYTCMCGVTGMKSQ